MRLVPLAPALLLLLAASSDDVTTCISYPNWQEDLGRYCASFMTEYYDGTLSRCDDDCSGTFSKFMRSCEYKTLPSQSTSVLFLMSQKCASTRLTAMPTSTSLPASADPTDAPTHSPTKPPTEVPTQTPTKEPTTHGPSLSALEMPTEPPRLMAINELHFNTTLPSTLVAGQQLVVQAATSP